MNFSENVPIGFRDAVLSLLTLTIWISLRPYSAGNV